MMTQWPYGLVSRSEKVCQVREFFYVPLFLFVRNLWTLWFLWGNSYICHTFFLILFFFISWRLITLQYCSGFCHTLTWISHGFTCVPHPHPTSHLPLHPYFKSSQLLPTGRYPKKEINSILLFRILSQHWELGRERSQDTALANDVSAKVCRGLLRTIWLSWFNPCIRPSF